MANIAHKPLIVIREKGVELRGVFRPGYVHRHIETPSKLEAKWLGSQQFESEFSEWANQVRKQKHIFMGYSSHATLTANKISATIAKKAHLTIVDWQEVNIVKSIWNSIAEAERQTSCGIFLFMKDDHVVSSDQMQFAPRDNVIYEAGYFAAAKGLDRAIFIHEDGAKIPSDLNGIIHLKLGDRHNIAPIEKKLKIHLGQMFPRLQD